MRSLLTCTVNPIFSVARVTSAVGTFFQVSAVRILTADITITVTLIDICTESSTHQRLQKYKLYTSKLISLHASRKLESQIISSCHFNALSTNSIPSWTLDHHHKPGCSHESKLGDEELTALLLSSSRNRSTSLCRSVSSSQLLLH